VGVGNSAEAVGGGDEDGVSGGDGPVENGRIRISFEEIIAHVSKDETLMPGEFIGSGTVGNGCGLELGWYLEHGDTIELEVEKIGILKNRVERQ
jgi:2-keto-4-pentenoate hydratase/2-oxohepta-3-ene-1,7-dioic acid hydratase in catechol pathway